MFPRITDIWPNLLRRIRGDHEGQDQDGQGHGLEYDAQEARLLQIDDQSDENDDELRVDEAKLMEDYKHTYWSRLVTVGADELE